MFLVVLHAFSSSPLTLPVNVLGVPSQGHGWVVVCTGHSGGLPPWGVIVVAAPGSLGTQPPFATWALICLPWVVVPSSLSGGFLGRLPSSLQAGHQSSLYLPEWCSSLQVSAVFLSSNYPAVGRCPWRVLGL